ncbi:hypothetical protein CWI37_0189p0020 [Hamiltosporidium tvaerminnensis]|uniref:BTB domain-containing protein n=1 Tax=Hamiltosporidium tvaerminnensis TaxID=1176355 RepID=A0A4Q9L8L2_9MICR|nr:hypothetical protein LUQ84_000392 [Hamiltosporidium tvaerminnensis]TBU04059.1 hypothetical protein CWI37_0189p0020 [Hamiltosporidium tvaerminnensis]
MIVLRRLCVLILNLSSNEDLHKCIFILNFGICRNKNVVFYWTENSPDERNNFNSQLSENSNENNLCKRKVYFNNSNPEKKKKILSRVIVSNVEKFPCRFNILYNETRKNDEDVNIQVSNFDFYDFKIFLEFLNIFYLPLEKLSIKNFFVLLNVFEYLDIKIDNNFHKIMDILLLNVYRYLKTEKKHMKMKFQN